MVSVIDDIEEVKIREWSFHKILSYKFNWKFGNMVLHFFIKQHAIVWITLFGILIQLRPFIINMDGPNLDGTKVN